MHSLTCTPLMYIHSDTHTAQLSSGSDLRNQAGWSLHSTQRRDPTLSSDHGTASKLRSPNIRVQTRDSQKSQIQNCDSHRDSYELKRTAIPRNQKHNRFIELDLCAASQRTSPASTPAALSSLDFRSPLQGYLAHQKHPSPQDHHRSLSIGLL